MTGVPQTIIPGVSQQAQCAACGFLVEKKGDLCPACQEKADARGPRGSADLRPWKVDPNAPTFLQDGVTERDPDAEDEEVDE